jgi:Flp pilus assembly protein TadG
MSAAEFALIMPVMLLIVCGIIDFGNLFYQLNIVNEAARDAARIYATSGGTASNATMQTSLRNAYNNNNLTLSTQTQQIGNATQVTATVSEPVSIMTPVINQLIPNNPTTVKGICIMQVE